RGLLKVGGVGRDVRLDHAVRLWRVTRAQELDRVGNDIDGLPLGAVLRFPLAPVKASLDGDRSSLGKVLGAVLALGAEDGDVEIVGLVDPLAALGLFAPAVDRNAQAAHRGPAGGGAKLGIASEVPGDDDSVDVGSCHELLPSQVHT